MSEPELASFAEQIGRSPALVRRWAIEGGCSEVADSALRYMRGQEEPPTVFAVGFVSCLAGVLLAGELIKEHRGRPGALDDTYQTAKFQFWNPTATANGRPQRVVRDPKCAACSPSAPGVVAWTQRALVWHPAHQGGAA